MALNLEPNLFDKMQPYLQALVKCAGGSNATFKNIKGKDCANLVNMYLDMNNYQETPPRRGGVFPYQLLKAYMAVLRRLKFVDPARKKPVMVGQDLVDALKEIVYKDGEAATIAPANITSAEAAIQAGGGGEDLNKIIKLSKSEVSGFVPYHVNNITGSYTEDYLSSLNSRIRKIDSQFGGFKKVTREVIGSVEDLDRILRADLENQIDNSVFKRYYKTYPIMSQKGGSIYIKQIWDWYHTKANPEEKLVFDAYAEFVIEETDAGSTLAVDKSSSKPTRDTDLTKGFLRVNLKKALVGEWSSFATNYTDVTDDVAKDKVPLILLVLTEEIDTEVLTLIFKYWYSKNIDIATGLDALLIKLGDGARSDGGTANTIYSNPPGLNDDGVFSCDKRILRDFINSDSPVNEDDDDINQFASKFNDYFKESGTGLLKNGWRWDRSNNSVQRKEKGKWVDYNPIDNPDEYRKIFNSADKCFNSYIKFNSKKKCCDLITLLAKGDTNKFFEAVRSDDVSIKQLDESFDNVNPITVVKLLEGFKFTKQKTWVPVHGNVYKFPNWTWWSRNVIDALDLTNTEKEKIKNKEHLRDVLEMSVAFVNNNLNLLNPHITYDNTGINSGTPDTKLELYKVGRYMPPTYSNAKQRKWWTYTADLRNRGSLPLNHNMPLFPMLGGQQFVLSGGSDNKKTEIVLDNTDIVPQFASQIKDDLKLLIESLKSKNKTLSPKEMEKLNKELEEFRKSEVNLINKVLLINKYLKVSNLLPNNEREYITENKMTKLISDYYENFKDYADKDLELKGIGSYMRSLLSDDISKP